MFKKTINISHARIQKNVSRENERLRGQNIQDYRRRARVEERTNERAIWSRRKENGNVKTPSASWRGKVVPAEMHHCASPVARRFVWLLPR